MEQDVLMYPCKANLVRILCIQKDRCRSKLAIYEPVNKVRFCWRFQLVNATL